MSASPRCDYREVWRSGVGPPLFMRCQLKFGHGPDLAVDWDATEAAERPLISEAN